MSVTKEICQRKKSYFTKKHAMNDMRKIHEREGREDMNVYECPHCFCWHVGHKPGTKIMKQVFRDVKPLKTKKYIY